MASMKRCRVPCLCLQQDLGLAEVSAGEAGMRDPSLPIVSLQVSAGNMQSYALVTGAVWPWA